MRGKARLIVNGEMLCGTCRQRRPVDDFWSPADGTRRFHDSVCSSCKRKYFQMRNHGLSEEQYAALYTDPRCAICGSDGSQYKGGLCIDHCHETLVIRGLLCSKCNHTIGWIEKVQRFDGALFTRYLKYLESNAAIVPANPRGSRGNSHKAVVPIRKPRKHDGPYQMGFFVA